MTTALTTYEDTARLGRAMVESGLFKTAATEAQAIVQIWAGRELGVGPVEALRGIHIIEGRLALSAGLTGALVKRSRRYNYRITEQNATRCEIAWFELGEEAGRSSFTIVEAAAAGLTGKAVWKAYPSDMLFARALTRGARRFCPDVFGGAVYDPEEIGDAIEAEYSISVADAPGDSPAPPPPTGDPPPITNLRVETGTSAPPPVQNAGNAPYCPTHPRYPMRAGKGGWYCSAKASAGQPANSKGYCSYRVPDVADAPPMFDAGGRTADEAARTEDEAALRSELSAALVAAQVTPAQLAEHLAYAGVTGEGGELPTMAQITAFAQERGLSFSELADAVAADYQSFE